MAGGTSSEIQEISLEFSFMVLVNNSFLKVVILGNLCGGVSGPPKARIQRNLAQSAQPIWIPEFSSGNTQSLSAYLCFLREIRKVYLRTLVFFEKYA